MWFDGLQPALAVTGQQAVQLTTGEAVLDGRFRDRELLGDDLQHDDAMLGHPPIRL